MSELGDFSLKLGLKTDTDAFQKGARAVDELTNNVSRLIGVAKGAAAVGAALTGIATVTSKVESANLHLANSLGISTKALDTWKTAAKIAGTDANGLIQGMAKLDEEFRAADRAEGPSADLITKLGLLGLNYDDLKKMKADERNRLIMQTALGMENDQLAQDFVSRILGGSAGQLFRAIKDGNQTLDQWLENAASRVFTDETSHNQALGFTEQLNTLSATVQNLSALGGSKIAGELTPLLEEVNKFFKDNGGQIANQITGFAESIGKIAKALAPFGETILITAVKTLGDLTDVLAALVDGNWEAIGNKVDSAVNNVAEGVTRMIAPDYDNFEEKAKEVYKKALASGASPEEAKAKELQFRINNSAGTNFLNKAKKFLNINDGIVRPNGDVVQVAPDDWIFAARNIGDMAAAFIPQNAGASQAGDIVINQSFTIGNSGNTLPQTIKEAAYNGTKGALEIFNSSANRLQLMPGLR